MRQVGEELFNKLKSRTILKRKPNLTVCSNHRKDEIFPKRIWDSQNRGTAIKNGKWYKEKGR